MLKLNHPNIVKVHQVFTKHDKTYVVMDYLSGRYGKSLDFILEKNKKAFDKQSCLSIFMQILRALDYCHEKFKIAHKGVKPQNIIMC